MNVKTGDIISIYNTNRKRNEYYIVAVENNIPYVYYCKGFGLSKKPFVKIIKENSNNIIIRPKKNFDVIAFKNFICHHKHINDNPLRVFLSIKNRYEYINLLYSIIYFLTFKKIWLGYSAIKKNDALSFIKQCYDSCSINIKYISNIIELYDHKSFEIII